MEVCLRVTASPTGPGCVRNPWSHQWFKTSQSAPKIMAPFQKTNILYMGLSKLLLFQDELFGESSTGEKNSAEDLPVVSNNVGDTCLGHGLGPCWILRLVYCMLIKRMTWSKPEPFLRRTFGRVVLLKVSYTAKTSWYTPQNRPRADQWSTFVFSSTLGRCSSHAVPFCSSSSNEGCQ